MSSETNLIPSAVKFNSSLIPFDETLNKQKAKVSSGLSRVSNGTSNHFCAPTWLKSVGHFRNLDR